MRAVSLRLRVTAATLVVLALSLAGFAVAVTLHYRSGLERDLRNRLVAGGLALQRTSPSDLKQLMSSLALEGIDVNLGLTHQAVTKPGAGGNKRQSVAAAPGTPPVTHPSVSSRGNLLVLRVPVGVSDPKLKRSLSPRPAIATTTATLTASQSSVGTPVHQLIVVEVVAGLIVIALAAVLLLFGLRTALSPLARVGRVAERIAAGDRGQRLNPEERNTELGRMAASFDEMVDALAASVERANRSEAAMRSFLAAASHELRTPIAALHATVETLLREQPPRPERDTLEAQLARESARLGTLVDDLLSLARLEGRDSLRREDVELVDIATEVVDETRARLPGIEIDISDAQDATMTGDTTVTGDADALARAVRNLVDNAVSATNGAGRVSVEVTRAGADVVLRVSDDGPGVPPGQRERIFDDFVRLDGNRRPGAGLGLAIVRRIAEQHDGAAICEEAGGGGCFALRIPAARHAAAQRAVADGPAHR